MAGALSTHVQRAVERGFHQLLVRSGEDVTQDVAQRSALLLAPHPDDETLGCAVTVMSKTDVGRDVWVVFATDGCDSHPSSTLSRKRLAEMRQAEGVEACRRLGVPPSSVHLLGFAASALDGQRAALARRLERIWREVAPDQVFVCSALDGHPDHRALSEVAAALWARGLPGTLYEYPIWFRVDHFAARWGRRLAARSLGLPWRAGPLHRCPAPVLVRTQGYLDRKRHALAAHVSQMERPAGEPDWATLDQVAGGRFLPRFFEPHELFFRMQRPIG